jgi:glycosyltransferase involved in cell wall biosynthesis
LACRVLHRGSSSYRLFDAIGSQCNLLEKFVKQDALEARWLQTDCQISLQFREEYMVKLSVITPSYNHSNFIEDTLQSVKAQNYPAIEHIVVDGASTDGTCEILKKYSQTPGWEHLRWISQPDKGQSDAINKGFHMATGDLVAWLNSDDYLLPGGLESIADYADTHPEIDVVYGDSIFVEKDGDLRRVKKEHKFDFWVLLYCGCYIQSNTAFYRRHVIDQGFFLQENYRVCMDYEYFVRLAAKGKTFGYANRPIAAFRWQGTNRSLATDRVRKERLQIQDNWSRPRLPHACYDAFARIFRMKRAVMKLCNGGYWKELRALPYRGIDTRWFRSVALKARCEELMS